MENHGWIKLHRKIQDNPFYYAEPFTKMGAWIDILLLCNHAPKTIYVRGNKIEINRGQFAYGEVTLAKKWRWSRNKVRRYLNWLQTIQQIEQQKNSVLSLYTVLNYNEYQGNDTTDDTTERQQTIQQKDINKNDKKEKNDKNETIQHTTIQGTQLSVIENQKELKRPDTLTDHSVSHYVIELFRDLNPDVARLHKLKGEADAAITLYRNAVKGNLDQLERAIKAIPEIAGDTFAPKDIKSISKPSQLLTHWALYCAQARGRKEKITKLSVTRL